MAGSPRIEDLRRRVQNDPASIAFAQLAEECRRVGQYQESIDVCRAGLAIHPGYLSARVTLGRAHLELDQLDEAQAELEVVLATASENLAALRGLAEIFHRRGSLAEALKHYRAALALARNDPDLQRTVTELSRAIEPKPPAPVFDGLSFEQLANEFLTNSPPPPPPAAPVVEPVPVVEAAPVIETTAVETAPVVEAAAGVEAAVNFEATSLLEASPAFVPSYQAPAAPEDVASAAAPVLTASMADVMAVWSSSEPAAEAAPEVLHAEASPADVWPNVSDAPVPGLVPGSVPGSVPESVPGTVPDPIAAAVPSGHNGTAHDLTPAGVDTLIPSLDASREETAWPADSIGQETDVPAVVLSESPLAAGEEAALTDEDDAAPPVEGATRAHAHATIAALDQWLDAIHVARADRRA